MDFVSSFLTMNPLAIVSASVLLLLYYLSSRIWPAKGKASPPEAAGAWPLIGHLHLLGGPQPPHMVLGNMADKHGPIFTINMGIHRTLVVSNWENAKECLATNDKVFANRPKTLATVLMAYDSAMLGFAPYGPYWRQIRKIAILELLSNQRLETLKSVRESEVKVFLKELYSLWGNSTKNSNKAVVEMRRWLGDITLNSILKLVVGKSVGYVTSDVGEENKAWKQALRDFFDLFGRFVPADAVPVLRWLDIGGFQKAMIRTSKELDNIVREWIKEHREKKAAAGDKTAGEEDDFMDVMLNVLSDEQVAELGRDRETLCTITCLTMILAASDTTALTIIWALSLLVNNPEALKKAQNELDIHVGRERQVQESDIKNLVYLQAILKETMRLYPAGPLSLPHESMEDCTVGGYNIPSGTRLLVNLWKIHHDPGVWEDPFEFRPQRFLTTHKDFDVRGTNFEFIPFGSGRRMCPGISFALQVLQLTLAGLLHGFDIENPSDEPIDMTESIGLTNMRANPLEIFISPRLPAHLYS